MVKMPLNFGQNGRANLVMQKCECFGPSLRNAKSKSQTSIPHPALMFASRRRHTEIVKLLLAHKKINVNAQGKEGMTALMKASEKGHTDIVKMLLSNEKINVKRGKRTQYLLEK